MMVGTRADGNRSELDVEDSGRGFDRGGVSDRCGTGLASMRERAKELGASLMVASARQQGTRVKAEVSQ